MRNGFTMLEIMVAVVMLSILCLVVGTAYLECNQMPKVYQAWVKKTGNEQGLTFEEWRLLESHEQSKRAIAPIIVPVNHVRY